MVRASLPLLLMFVFLLGAAATPQGLQSTRQPVPPDELLGIDRRELGPLYDQAHADKYLKAHQLLEDFFVASSAKDRQAIAAELASLGLDANVLGRLVRVRLHWPALEAGVYYINERVGPHQVQYFVGVPRGYDRGRAVPLVIRLPGAHPFITDPPPNEEQVAELYTQWIIDELRKHPDAAVLMPRLNLDELWGPSYKGMNGVIQPLHHVAGRLNIDPARVYMTGHGMSGHATWNLALHYPTYFAAINPMSGGASATWQRLRIMNLRNTPAVVWHDADDPLVKVEGSRSVVQAMKREKLTVDYEEGKTGQHAPSEEVIERQYAKMRSYVRPLYPRTVSLGSNRPDSLFNRNDWVQVYQMLTPGNDRRLGIVHGSGTMTFQQNSYSITATLAGPNRIEVQATNVESQRFYLNDQTIDFTKPVTVLINKRVRFEGMVKPSVEEMLKDQLFLGRGWRYFTAFVDVDFGEPTTRPTTAPTTRRGTIEYNGVLQPPR